MSLGWDIESVRNKGYYTIYMMYYTVYMCTIHVLYKYTCVIYMYYTYIILDIALVAQGLPLEGLHDNIIVISTLCSSCQGSLLTLYRKTLV